MFSESTIRDGHHREVSFEEFLELLRGLHGKDYEFAVGTDSQNIKRKTVFVTALVAHHRAKGARFWYIKEKLPRKDFQSLQRRLMFETMRSLWAAIEVEESVGISPMVHLDLGTDEIKSKSAKYVAELTNMVTNQGYGCAVKPYSWASDCADRFAKS